MIILLDSLFLQTGLQKDNFVESAEATGCKVYVSEYIRNFKDFESWVPKNETMLVYGSIQFVEDALKHFNNAVAFYSQRLFNCSYFMSHLPVTLFVNHDAEFYPLGFYRQIKANRRHYGIHSTADRREYFIRSDSGRKLFAGKEVESSQLHRFDSEGLSLDSTILVASPKSIGLEIRYFIYKRDIISRTVTHVNGVPIDQTHPFSYNKFDAFDKFASKIAGIVNDTECLDKIYVCDVASYRNEGYEKESALGIMEFNAASTSDMHLCDITKVFDAMIDCINKENACE